MKKANLSKLMKSLSYFFVFLVVSCSVFTDMGGNTQSLEQLTATPFIAELNSSTTKTIALNVDEKSHVAWIGFDQSGDYKYFKVDQISVNGKVTENETGSSTEVFENMTVSPSTSSSTGTSSYPLLLTITYKAKTAMEAEDDPFSASLLVVFDYPETKTIQVQMNGYVQGICDDCVLSPDHQYIYEPRDNDGDGFGDIEFYLCDSSAIPASEKENGALPDGTNPETSYAFDYINLEEGAQIVIYTADKKPGYFIIDAGEEGGLLPTIPDFEIQVPGGEPVESVDVSIEDNTQSICPDEEGVVTCSSETDSGISLEVAGGILNVDPMTFTNTAQLAVSNTECGDFGTWDGGGTVGADDGDESTADLTVLGIATISDSQTSIVTETGINGALIVAVIKLDFISDSDL